MVLSLIIFATIFSAFPIKYGVEWKSKTHTKLTPSRWDMISVVTVITMMMMIEAAAVAFRQNPLAVGEKLTVVSVFINSKSSCH